MSSTFLQGCQVLLAQFWRFFNSWYLPGTNVTPAGLFFCILVGITVIKFIRRLFNVEKGEVK